MLSQPTVFQETDSLGESKTAVVEETKQEMATTGEEEIEQTWTLMVEKFDDMALKEELLRGIYAFGFKDPSPI